MDDREKYQEQHRKTIEKYQEQFRKDMEQSKWMNDKPVILKESDLGKKLSLEESRQINEKYFPELSKKLDQEVLYDKKFLLEVSMAGYDALDPEDVENFRQGLPAKQADRNMIICGATGPNKVSNDLGMSKYEENDMEKFLGVNPNIDIQVKKPENLYLSDFQNKKTSRLLLTEDDDLGEDGRNRIDMDDENARGVSWQRPIDNGWETPPKRNMNEIDDSYRTNMARAMGSDGFVRKELGGGDIDINKETGINKFDERASKMLEVINELRALGLSPEQIVKEIRLLNGQ